ncbi:MAG: TonB-dependent receptor [Burkholderiales bacterium]|nr:TonB-dependent receptor [Burkholderiales bacterium]
MFQKSKLYASILLAFSGGVALTPALAQQAAEPTQRVEVTGSAIKRTSVEGPAPLEVVTRKDIERTGATSINELLSSIPSIDIFNQGELASNSPAGSGTASVRLRGLSDSETLVLLNGRRMPVNALYDSSGAGAAFDINSLPIGAIERIEIMKDGGSAIYGADAVAGVVNFITKTDYQGIEANVSYGVSSEGDGAENRLGLSAGFGDLDQDGYNILLGLDYFKRDPILRKDRDISRSVDFTRFGAPRDGRSGFSPYGNVIDPITGGFVGVTYRDCPEENLSNGICRYDFNASLLTAYNGADRLSGLALGTVKLSPDIRAFGEVIFSQSKDTFLAHPVPDYFIVPIIDESQRPYEILDADGNGTGNVYIAGRFMQGGPRTTDRKSEFINAAIGVEGVSFGLDWKASLSHGESKVTNSDSNYYNANLWFDATSSGALDPTVSTNDQALVDSLKVTPKRVGKSTLSSFNAQVSGDLFKMPGGMSKWAVGTAFNQESLKDTPDELTQQGLVVGSIQQAAVDADREFWAVYGELALPIFKQLEAQVAVRYDSYPGSSSTSPKIGLKYTPTSSLAFRASYTESFRAPVLKQLFGAQEEGAITITNPDQCLALGVPLNPDGSCLVNAYQVNGANPDLGPEKGKTFNLGVVMDFNSMFSASVDLWEIRKKDDISSPSINSAIEQGLFEKIGPRYYIYTNLQNIAERETAGVDVDGRLRLGQTALGKVTLRNLLTYYSKDRSKSDSGGEWAEYLGTYARPYFRNNFSVTTELGSWILSGAWKTVGGFWDSDLPFPDAVAASGNRRVGNFEELDLQVQYSGFKGLELTAGVKNALDRMPPLSLQNGTDNTYTQMGFAELYSSRGRFFYLGAKYAF